MKLHAGNRIRKIQENDRLYGLVGFGMNGKIMILVISKVWKIN